MQAASALEDLPGEGPQAQLQGISVGGLLVHVVQTRHVDIDLTQGREALAHPLGIEVHPIGDVQVQLQQGEAASEEVPQAEPAGELGEVRVEQRDVTEEIEAVHRLDAHLVGRRSERLAVEVGHHEATPIEDGVAVDGDTPLARIAGEETDEVEVVVAHHVDGGLRCLHRDVELITPVLPRDREGRASGELHLLAGAAVAPLGYLHAPENALVLRAQLSKVSESESSHPAVV